MQRLTEFVCKKSGWPKLRPTIEYGTQSRNSATSELLPETTKDANALKMRETEKLEMYAHAELSDGRLSCRVCMNYGRQEQHEQRT